MAVRTVLVRLQADATGYMNAMRSAGSATQLIGAAGLVAGGAVVAGLGMAVKKSAEFEKAMSGIQAATGASAGTLDQLRASAMKAGADTQYSATEAANAITEMSKAGVSAKDIMGGGLSGALSLAAAGQLEVADAAGIASVAMTQFSLSGKDLPHVADLLAAGAGKAMGSVEDLGMALKQGGLVASSAGLSIEETTGGLAAFASAGLIGSDAGTSFKTMLQALQAPSGKAANLMSDLGLNMYDSQGKMLGLADMAGQLQTHLGGLTEEQRNSALATIFGSDAVRAANVLYKEGAAGIQDWTNKVNDQGYAQKQAAALTDNLSGDLERLGGSFDTLLISIGSGTQGPLRELVQLFTGLLNGAGSLVDVFSSIPGPVLAGVGAFAALAALRGPLNIMFAQMAVSIMSTVTGLSMATGATSLFGLAAAGARTAVAGLITTAAPLAGLIAASYAVKEVLDFIHAGDGATQSVKDMEQAIEDADSNGARFDATTSAIDGLKKKAAEAQAAIDAIDNKSYLSKVFLSPFNGDTGAIKDNEEALKSYQAALHNLQAEQAQQAATVDAVGAKFHLTSDAVLDLADKYKIDLSQGVDSVTSKFASSGAAAEVARAGVATVGDAAVLTDDQIKEAAKELDKWLKKMQEVGSSFVDPLALYTSQLSDKSKAEQTAAENTAIATKDSSDSWQDYVNNVGVSLDAYATKLEEQLNAQDHWRENIITITQRGGIDVGNAIEAMGKDGIQLAAQMADGTDAQFKRMADLLVRDAQNGGADAAAAFKTQMDIMAEVGAEGASATALQVAQKLGIGLDQVAKVAAQYGVKLADGINPVLSTLGATRIVPGKNIVAGYGHFASGGYTGDGGKYTPAGIVHKGEFVMPQEAVKRIGVGNLGAMAGLPGYASGGFVTAADVPRPPSTAPYGPPISTAADGTMLKGYNAATAWMDAHPASVGPSAGAGVQRWLPVVLQALGMVGQPASLAQTVLRRMNQESGGNPTIVNRWDSNWTKGTPSVGLMQVIGPTYRATHDRRHDVGPYLYGTSVDGLSNLLSSMHYALNRYGSLSAAYNRAGGYANGGTTPANEPFWVGERGPELMWSSREQYVSTAAQSREFSGGMGGRAAGASVKVAPPQVTVHFHVDGEEFRGMTRTEVDGALAEIRQNLVYG